MRIERRSTRRWADRLRWWVGTKDLSRRMSDLVVPVERIVVVGAPGSGKTTFARELSRRSGIVHIERDALDHPDDPVDGLPEHQREAVLSAMAAARDGWVLDGAPYWYEGEVYPRVQRVIALDYPRAIVVWRCARRAVRRILSGSEPIRDLTAPTHPLRWAWAVHGQRRREIAELPARFGVDVVVLRSPRATRAWLRACDDVTKVGARRRNG